ncbi:GAF domain-containing sensor histidine kinase [Pseudonocardia humida]|uniref:GAF domain-containing sensor histidine kinase n=1 Tax=Pseudonocardia humida TaxID=2800819 RepID=UPI00207D08A2|nr:GAF domain-containing sensor histidine kinase [Pseudonocardia humida]
MRALRLLNTPPEDRFDRITRVARDLLDVPIAMITLVEVDRQWTKSAVGAPARELPRNKSFSSHVLAAGKLLEVFDATLDERFAHFPTVVGEPFVRFYAGQPIAAPSGYLVGALCVADRVPRRLDSRQRRSLRDLAAWVELEYAVPRSSQWERDAERARRDFVSVVSHELRTPLTSIRGSLELIESGRFGELTPMVAKLVGIAAKNAGRMVRLAEDVVDLHLMQRGKLHLRLATLTLPEVVDQAVLAVRDVADRASVQVEVSCDDPAPLRGDADRLVQVLTNLLVNAVNVSPPQGTVTVHCGTDGAWAECSVRDHGPGIPQGQLDEIFEPFVQFEVPGQRRNGRAGLGLAIAGGIVAAHGGHLGARPAEGGGSVFEVSLPTTGPDSDRPWW